MKTLKQILNFIKTLIGLIKSFFKFFFGFDEEKNEQREIHIFSQREFENREIRKVKQLFDLRKSQKLRTV